jgi:hypothetical protein
VELSRHQGVELAKKAAGASGVRLSYDFRHENRHEERVGSGME